ncbi:DUF1186 domain-containing protein [Algibacillus agarilyticus]|uniref:DUF1186 domain-containing protein n=1 Tax=Algibacillus agarilyticus TaxID=2234133 RepID=UPI000DD043E1|nr:DUF1186 domain-containing protein [Algibacillus agarilyticus]
MKLTEITEHLSTIVNGKPPIEAILAAKENWSEFLPVIVELMNKFHQETLTKQENTLLFMGILLLVEMQQHDAFENFIVLCDGDDEYAEPLGELLGDSVTEGLSSYFYILANGRHESLAKLLSSKVAGEYIRKAALEAIFSQYESEQISKETLSAIVDCLLVLYKEQNDFYLLGSLACLLMNYQWQEYQPQILALFDDDYLESLYLSRKNIEKWQTTAKSKRLLESGLVKKELDVMAGISNWICYSPTDNKISTDKKSYITAKTLTPERIAEDKKAPGRNEPCHCGSGKKYKKCCM